jgi:hypothetical protein
MNVGMMFSECWIDVEEMGQSSAAPGGLRSIDWPIGRVNKKRRRVKDV